MSARVLPAALAVPAGIHLGAAVQHDLLGTHGAFFVVAGLAQGALAVLVGRGVARATLPAVVLSGGLVAVWLATRLPGLASAPEPVGVLDVAATTLEVVAVAAGVALRRSGAARVTRSSPLRPVLVLPAVALVAVSASFTAPAHDGHSHGPHTHGPHPHAEPSEPIFGDLFEDHHGAPADPTAPADHVDAEGSEPHGH